MLEFWQCYVSSIREKAPAHDCLPNGFLKRYAVQLSVFLTGIFQTSLASGEVPYDFLVVRVKPLFKSGDKLAISNYRPIFITSSCCKMLEHVIAGLIHEFLVERNILSPYQHGFRKKKCLLLPICSLQFTTSLQLWISPDKLMWCS